VGGQLNAGWRDMNERGRRSPEFNAARSPAETDLDLGGWVTVAPLGDRRSTVWLADWEATRYPEAGPSAPAGGVADRRPAGGRHRVYGRRRHASATTS
jgi:hypothetical protein